MATLTISVDPETLRLARIRALERGESVNKYLNDMLERYARPSQRDITDSLIAMADAHPATSGNGERSWTRDELYDG
ncbi:hypothetical protein [Salana multivorans]